MKREWVKGHTDKLPWTSTTDLLLQKLGTEEIFNVWCDRITQQTWTTGATGLPDPEVSHIKQWSVYAKFPSFHKIIGDFDSEIFDTLSYKDTIDYISHKHGITQALLERISIHALRQHIESLPIHIRASTIKLIHGWMPTYAILCRQGRSSSSLCPRCHTQVETPSHVFKCQANQAIQQCLSHLTVFLTALNKLKTPVQIVATLQYKLSLLLDIPFEQTYFITMQSSTSHHYALIQAICHQNIIGWNNFMRGYISTYWAYYISIQHPNCIPNWDISLISHILTLTTAIWRDRNRVIHGDTKKAAAALLRERTIRQVYELHQNPPFLHRRYPKITSIPLSERLSRSTTYLQRWLDHVQHQKQITRHIQKTTPCAQTTIP
jgi:hypothetical protein